jgi:hypothetical protein
MTASDKTKDGGSSLRDTQPVAETPVVSGQAHLHAIAKAAALGVHENGGCVPQMAFAPILWALQDDPLVSAAPDLLGAAIGALYAIEGGRIYERQCCDGRECGCFGMTSADEALHYLRTAITKATTAAETVSVGRSEANAPSLPTGDA